MLGQPLVRLQVVGYTNHVAVSANESSGVAQDGACVRARGKSAAVSLLGGGRELPRDGVARSEATSGHTRLCLFSKQTGED